VVDKQVDLMLVALVVQAVSVVSHAVALQQHLQNGTRNGLPAQANARPFIRMGESPAALRAIL
jgi:hypothetical protein